MSDNSIYTPSLRLQAAHNAPLRGGEHYQFGFYDAGILRSALDALGPESSYKVWTLPIPATEAQLQQALSFLEADDVQYALVDKNKIVYVTIDGVPRDFHGWLGFMNALGYQVHSGPKSNKRLKSFHRPTLLNATFDHLNILYVEPTDFTRYDFTNQTEGEQITDRLCDPAVTERLLDGGFVISRRLVQTAVKNLPAYDLGENADPYDYYYDPRVRRQLVADLLGASVFNARLIFEDGFLKGNCFVSDDLPEGVDVITSRTNVKAEITFHNGFQFQAEPQSPKTRVFTDDQTVVNFPKLFNPSDLEMWLREDYKKLYNDAINNRLLTNWKYIYQRMWREKDDMNENEARARMAYVGYRWRSCGLNITDSPWLFETISISQAKPLEKRISIPCSVYEQVIPESLARMAGHDIEVEEETIVRLSALGVHVVNDLDWLEMYESHGGHDQDDFFKLFYRTMDGGDHDGERVVITMRSPNGFGEYSVFRYVDGEWFPKWHMADGTEVTFPLVDGTEWPERLSDAIFRNTVTYTGFPSKQHPQAVRSGPYLIDDVVRDIRIAMAGGNVGGYVNACMVHASTLAAHRDTQLCSLEDAIDKCINPDDAADVKAIDIEAKLMMREVVDSGRPIDRILWQVRGSTRHLKPTDELTFYDGILTQLYQLCRRYNVEYQADIRAWSQTYARPPQIIHDLGKRLYHWTLPHMRLFRAAIYDRNSSQETAMNGRIVRNNWESLYEKMAETIESYERIQDRYDFVLGLYSTTMSIPTSTGKLTDQIVMNRYVYPLLEAALQYYGIARIPMYDVRHNKVEIHSTRIDEWYWPDEDDVLQQYTSPVEFQTAHAKDTLIDFTKPVATVSYS